MCQNCQANQTQGTNKAANDQATGLTKVTFEFPGGGVKTFETKAFVGAFIDKTTTYGAQIGGFATGSFSPVLITGMATAIIEVIAKEMINQGFDPNGIKDTLLQIIPRSVDSAAIREIDSVMDKLETGNDPILAAIAQLLKMTAR